jgi:nucleotide-binding universal stress UspA family protein
MIPKISKILYATDLTKNSAYAFRYAINSAEKHDARIDILHVYPPSRFVSEMDWPADSHEVFEESKSNRMEKIRQRLEAIIQREQKENPALSNRVSSINVVEGDPAAEILRKADELKSDILIMGTHGKGLIAYAFLGSVASQVLHRIRIPVFIVPIPKETDISFDD